MTFAKLLALVQMVRKFIQDLLAAVGGTPPAGAQAAVSEAQKTLAHANALITECEAAKTPEAQAALMDRLKNLFALLMKLLGGLGVLGV